MYLVINKCVTAVKVSNFSGHYSRNRSTLDIGVLGYIGIVQRKEHSPEILSIPPGTSCILQFCDARKLKYKLVYRLYVSGNCFLTPRIVDVVIKCLKCVQFYPVNNACIISHTSALLSNIFLVLTDVLKAVRRNHASFGFITAVYRS